MHVEGDLGFSSLVILVFCVVAIPVGWFVIRCKWRGVVARKEEIKRLMVLAAEEAARAELEATVSYGTVPVLKNNYQCVVCFCPRTTRCARCKAVRYCSGKCQIIHWRQGHKEECRPPPTTYHINDDGGNPGQRAAKQDQDDIYDGRYEKRPIETFSVEPVVSDSSYSPGVSLLKDDDIIVDSVLDTEGADSISESPGTSFSGFSTPTGSSFSGFSAHSNGESSDSVSVSESISSNETEGSDRQTPADIAPDTLESSLNEVDTTKPSSPKFSTLVDSIDSFNKLSKSNQSKPHGNDRESQCSSSSSSHSVSARNDETITKPAKVSSGFWGRTLDSVGPSSDAGNGSALSNFNGPGNSKSSNDKPSLLVKSSLSGRDAPMSHAKSSKVNSIISDDAPPSVPGVSRPADGAVSPEKNGFDALKVKRSPTISFERSNLVDNNSGGGSNVSIESKSVSSSSPFAHVSFSSGGVKLDPSASKVCRSQALRSERSNVDVDEIVNTSHLSKSRSSSSASQTHLNSSVGGHSVSSVKLGGKVENVEPGAAATSQISSYSPNSINGLKSSVWKVVDQFRGPKCGRYSNKGLFPYDLFVKLYTSNKVEMRPCGLINCGNSCYANAVLQCLAFTPPLTSYFVQGLHSKACVNKERCFSCEFENVILKAKEGKSPLSPIGILSQLQNIGSQLGNGREEDAHEFLRYAIDAMQSVCLKEARVNAVDSFEEEATLIGLTFGGYLRSKIKCMKCHYKSEWQERMMDLTVEIEGDIGKLEDALRRFTGTEILDGDNKYHCGRCRSYEKAKKKLTILEAPNVLTIALKRFQSGKFGKLNKSIRFPEILDLAPYMSGTSDKSPVYRLYGVIVHLDVMNAAFSGHYVCYVKNIQNKWFKVDDSTVTAVELERVLSKGAYMLLYARCSPRAPRLIRSRIISSDPKNKCSPSKIKATNTALNSRSMSMQSNVVQLHPDSIPLDNLASVESSYLKLHRLLRISEEDLSSDNFSFTSGNSDEGSCSTDSTHDSTSTDDLSDYIFGSWNSWRNASDSDTSSSSSPLYSRYSPHADKNQNDSHTYSRIGGRDLSDRIPSGGRKLVDLEGKGGNSFLHPDTTEQCRKLASSNSCRDKVSTKLGSLNPLNDVKSGVSFRRSVSERTD
ncbi:ubiquitin carboxyl-terminal hydrolase 16 isoform X1 [Populus alba]|uniref:ubiquitinyl hydrolase 1 n=1 Tax=Populus alba TaxID=43335 RepID=A0A4U5PQJ2_POPAL|nr:ubiquitin carboxyl-terminal hydrolase 16 isoform X1 [Populus alba]TKR99268.1 UBIQUITIN-SPECIFIC PROTEASE 16 family protein [Populus alba]